MMAARGAEGSPPQQGIAQGTAQIIDSRLWSWADETACAAAAASLASASKRAALSDATIELHGPLGAGKTTFVRHLLRALGVAGRIKSPTYAVVEPYRVSAGPSGGPLDICHFDFYRFDDARELVDAGLRDLFAAPGLKLIEWPSRAAALLPRADLRLTIEPKPEPGGTAGADDRRRVLAEALTPRGAELLA
jgi:tRNA threonylcarbamoyladenosine biosynthesis protein TsaE